MYSYDSMGRKTSKAQTTNGKTFTVGYSWGDSGSALDKLTAITYPSGARVNYSYDTYGDVSGITVNPPNTNGVGTNTGSTLPMLSAITRNAESKLTGWAWASGKTQAISYDGNGQIAAYNLGDPTGADAAAGIRRTVGRDSAGRITGYTHTSNGTAVPVLDQGFAYDNLNRLTSATLSSTSIQYGYDATGNRTAKVISGTSYPNTISAISNKLTQTQDIIGTATVVHDAAGNITGDGLNTYTYSDRGRMATMTNGGGTVTYSYNALELRVGKTGPTAMVPTGAIYYVYDEEGKLLGEYDANGTPLYETIYLGIPVGVVKQAGTAAGGNVAISLYNVSTDQIGAPRIITRQSDEAVVWRWDTAEAFGATAPDQNPSSLGIFSFNQRLPGQVFDAESGLFQNWNREYNPRIGRYMQSDPIGLRGGINTFAYVGGDPLGSSDPMGLFRVADLFPEGAPIVTIGNAYGALAAYAVGVATGDKALTREGMEGLQCNRLENMEVLGVVLSMGRGRGPANKAPDFIVSPRGTVFPVPQGAQGPTQVVNPGGRQTGSAYTGGSGGANSQVATMRIMDPTPPRGNSPGYPNGYVKYENGSGQGVNPYTGKTLPNSQSHFPR